MGKCIVARIFESKKFVEVLPLTEEDQSSEVLNQAMEEILRVHCEGKFSAEKAIKIRLSTVEDKIEVYKTKVYKRPSSSNEFDVSHNVPESSCAPSVANLSTVKRHQKQLNNFLLSLYKFCTRRPIEETKGEILVRINSHILTRAELETLGPRRWVDNLVFIFASPMMMEE